ncbi:RrF2 family transcriptional regulator [Olsenella massiliensis]|uniref:RrF2 family transcriptional regulator n=1 Tax=Olsenella massiliensis TaxID=1622075 RepID=UPI00071C4672|nr:Rrf2 family transcriptional regulator [Olsenella massiliensis]
MELSKKLDYAMRMVAELVENEGETISVRVAAENRSVPYTFARSIQRDLARGGIIESSRGSRGGMRLLVDPRTTTIRSILESLQGPIKVSVCDHAGPDGGYCPFAAECHFNPVWCEAENILRSYFDAMTLHDVIIEHKHPVLSKGNRFELVSPQGQK